MARDWNDYEAKLREEIERKVARAQAQAERKADRARERAERAAERFKERAGWYAEKVKDQAHRQAEKAEERFRGAAGGESGGGSHWSNRVHPFGMGFQGWGCQKGAKRNHDSEIFAGMAILAVGLGLLLINLHLFEMHELIRFWPVALIIAGALRIGRARFVSASIFGIFLMAAGVIFLLGNLGVVRISWNLFWPAVMILIGLQHLLRRFDPTKPDAQQQQAQSQAGPASSSDPFAGGATGGNKYGPETPTSGPRAADVPPSAPGPDPWFAGAGAPPPFSSQAGPAGFGATVEPDVHLHEYCIFTGGKRRIVSNNFRGGEIVAVFGGVEVDLRGSQLGGDEAVIDITAAFGGCNIKVPTNWYVEMRGVAAFGGYSDKTIPPRVSPGQRIQKLVVTGSAAFGGVVIEN
ncbi:MAG TPA: DUF5668 domain-containing protein [Bryobacteraceae bacterium]|jgi:predicted membrane protein